MSIRPDAAPGLFFADHRPILLQGPSSSGERTMRARTGLSTAYRVNLEACRAY
ncbi:hypothetical protein [Thiocapsa rosea]|uniref:hypothetical protein n=1 Tax=Thiocapsa rosea TaxID=69360 RepID=UPI001474FC5A|nr:hypothetical protein [Thiocapsa rosea]